MPSTIAAGAPPATERPHQSHRPDLAGRLEALRASRQDRRLRSRAKDALLALVRHLPVGAARQEALLFYLKLGYWPDFAAPRSFNEKINARKLRRADPLMVSCIDKLAVRDYVASKAGAELLIPLRYHGESIDARQLHALGDNIVAKPNHDSRSAEILLENTPQAAAAAARRLRRKLRTDFGRRTNQVGYSQVPRRVLVEELLVEEAKLTPDDYKIFCFRQADGSTEMLLELHENRDQPDYRTTLFDAALNPIPVEGAASCERPFPHPGRWPEMRAIAEALSADFDHVRVDLYLVGGRIFFGELTFFDGGGRVEYTRVGGARNDLDREMGQLWTGGC